MTLAPHILVVDDHREIRDALAKYLEKNGMRVTVAANAAAMDVALKAGAFDLIVLDVMMPGEDGLSVCRRLRASRSIPILMLTALGEETDRIVGLEIGSGRLPAQALQPARAAGPGQGDPAPKRADRGPGWKSRGTPARL